MDDNGQKGILVEFSSPAHILIVAHKTAATPALLDAIRERVERGPAFFHLLVPNPAMADWHPAHAQRRQKITDGERVLAHTVPLIEEAAHRPTDGSVSIRHDPMDAIEEAVCSGDFDEIILLTRPSGVSRRLHVDLSRRVAHLGLPVTTVIAHDRKTAGRTAGSRTAATTVERQLIFLSRRPRRRKRRQGVPGGTSWPASAAGHQKGRRASGAG